MDIVNLFCDKCSSPLKSHREYGRNTQDVYVIPCECGRKLLMFALSNRDKFTEHDPDGVKARWIKQVEKWDKMP